MWLLALLACPPTLPADAPTASAGPDLLAFVGEPIHFDGTGSVGTEAQWRAGDGAVLDGFEVDYTYTRPGLFQATLEVCNSDGESVVDSLAVSVVHPPADPAPRRSTTMAATSTALWVLLPDHGTVAVLDRATGALLEHVEACVGARGIDATDTSVVVTCPEHDAIAVLGDSPTFLQLPRGSRPASVLVQGEQAHVTLQGTGSLATVSLADGTLLRELPLGPDARGLASLGDQLFVSRHRSASEGGTWWWIRSDDVQTQTLPLDPGPDSDVNARGVPSYLQHLAIRPDGRQLAVGGLKANIERGVFREGRALTHETTVRADLRLAALHPAEGEPGSPLPFPIFDDRDLVSDVAYSPRGDRLYALISGTGHLEVLDAVTLQKIGGTHGIAPGATGLWVDPESELVWVDERLERRVTAWNLSTVDASRSPVLETPTAEGLEEPLTPAVLLGKRVFHSSGDRRMTESGYVSCASCHLEGDQDGRVWDFTDRGEGLRNTLPLWHPDALLPGIDSPIHWTGNFDEVQDFEHDIRGPQAGLGFLADTDWATTNQTLGAPKAGLSPELDALAAYVHSLTQVPTSPLVPDASDVLAGELLFNDPDLGCASCHPAPHYTDAGWLASGEPRLHDVGTLTAASGHRLGASLDGLDTPSLRGVHATAPYLHDGSAPTLEAVLGQRNPNDMHGNTSHLTAEQREQLVTFLRSLD